MLFVVIKSVVKSFKVSVVEVVAARLSNESAFPRMTDSTPKTLVDLTLVVLCHDQGIFSSRCPDCGMDPQDVPHLFDCIAHPIDLSPVNLLGKPIETIRELSFLDPGNLN